MGIELSLKIEKGAGECYCQVCYDRLYKGLRENNSLGVSDIFLIKKAAEVRRDSELKRLANGNNRLSDEETISYMPYFSDYLRDFGFKSPNATKPDYE